MPILLSAIAALAGPAAAEPLRKLVDGEGNVHFGTASDPHACCMCQPALDHRTGGDRTTFLLRHGLRRTVGNERVFLSADGEAWYCEGTREIGRFGDKCGLVPPLM